MKAFVHDNTIGEIFPVGPGEAPLAERFTPELVAQMVDVPDNVHPGWVLQDSQWVPPPGLTLYNLKTIKENDVWSAIRAELNKHYDQPWQTAATQLQSHYEKLLARDDVPQEIKDKITAVMPKFVQVWQYLMQGSSFAGANRVAAIRALTTVEEAEAYTVDLSDWVANDPQITMSQITVPGALAILPKV